MWRISCLRPAKMTVGGTYRKAEMPLCTKHCATFWFWHLLIREERRSNSIYMFSNSRSDFVFTVVFIKQHQMHEWREREPVLNFSFTKSCLWAPSRSFIWACDHKCKSYWLDRFIRNLLHWSHVNVDCLNRCINIQNTIFIALIICLGVNRYLNYSNNGF